jgi:UDP-N-acetylglucosamine acyltransferase
MIMEDTTPKQNLTQNSAINLISDNIDTVYFTNFIHPTAIIGENVILGKGNTIKAHCIITGNTVIGDNNTFKSFSVIGSEPEHKAYFGKPNKGVGIGNNNVIREYVTINAGCERTTIIESNCILLRGSHIGHDSIVNDNVTISCNVLVGGHSIISKNVNLGLGAILHQFSKIAPYSMIGMGAIVTKKSNIQCFGTYVGNPAKYIKENDYQKQKFDVKERDIIRKNWEKYLQIINNE